MDFDIIQYIIYIIAFVYLIGKFFNKSKVQTKNLVTSEENEWKKIKLTITKITEKHKKTLAIQRHQLVYTDVYGKQNLSNWYSQGVEYFISTQIEPKIEKNQYFLNSILLLPLHYKFTKDERIRKIVEDIARKEHQLIKKDLKSKEFNPKMSGIQFEEFCKNRLENNGWNVIKTKVTGDQGVDLIATKPNRKIAIQCKKYSRPVGNSAVQEVVSGIKFYLTDSGVVITNSTYTKSAIQLAEKNNIKLIHHIDIENL